MKCHELKSFIQSCVSHPCLTVPLEDAPFIPNHNTVTFNKLNVPNRCFWSLSQLSLSLAAPVPTLQNSIKLMRNNINILSLFCFISGVFKKGLANDQIILNICVLRGVSIFGMSHSYIRFWFLVVRTDSESIFHSKLSLIKNWLLIEWIERKEQFSAFCSSLCLRDINGAEQQSAVTNFNCLMFVLQC